MLKVIGIKITTIKANTMSPIYLFVYIAQGKQTLVRVLES